MSWFEIPQEWRGETAVIYGGGPSLHKDDVQFAVSRGWRRIACNWAFLLDGQADVLTWADQRWFFWAKPQLHRHTGKWKIAWKTVPQFAGIPVHHLFQRQPPPALSVDPGSVVANNTGQGAINLAFHFGARRILLLGFDMRTRSNQHNWHNHHRGRTVSPERYRNLFLPSITAAGKELEKHGVEVINCTKDSGLKCFPYQDIRSIKG